MGFSTAWAIQNEETSAASARDLLHTAMGGNVGVGGPDHLRVEVLSADTIGLTPGKLSIRAGSSGVRQWQTYGVTVTATDGEATAQISMPSSQERTLHAVVVVNDPEYAGVDGSEPLVDLRVVTNAELNDLTIPYHRVAYLVIPADETALTDSMVRDRRNIARPQWDDDLIFGERSGNTTTVSEHTSPGWRTVQTTDIVIPEWCSQIKIDAAMSGLALYDGRFQGNAGIFLDGSGVGTIRLDENFPGHWIRFGTMMGGTIAIPESMRGATVPLSWRLQWDSGVGHVEIGESSYFKAHVFYRQVAD